LFAFYNFVGPHQLVSNGSSIVPSSN